jgi:hypothetical protein
VPDRVQGGIGPGADQVILPVALIAPFAARRIPAGQPTASPDSEPAA